MADAPPPSAETRCWGFLKRKQLWVPSAKAWLMLVALAVGLGALIFFGAEPFLVVTERVDAKVLVVEGWLPDYALMEGWNEFKAGNYSEFYTTGGRVKNGWHVEDTDTYATWAAYRLQQMVGKQTVIQPAPAHEVKRDRTYASALALRKWLGDHHKTVTALNVVTLGPHARRSRMLYRKAFGPEVKIGIIAIQDEEYEKGHWWKYSEGLKEVFAEGMTYLYALLFLPFLDKN